jgi:hypothetical protein
MILEYNTFGQTGYNMTIGGEGTKGHVVSEELKQKSREWHLQFRHTEESKHLMAEKFTKMRGRKVNQYTKEGQYVATFDSCALAAKAVGSKNSNGAIHQLCSGTFKRWAQVLVKGFQWKFDTGENRHDIDPAPDLQSARIQKLINHNKSSANSISENI